MRGSNSGGENSLANQGIKRKMTGIGARSLGRRNPLRGNRFVTIKTGDAEGAEDKVRKFRVLRGG